MKERHLRSIIKGITWRVVATVDTIALSYLVTESVTMAFKIASIELFTKTVLYYFHERIWLKVKGRRPSATTQDILSPKDAHTKSLIKGITWRVFGTIDTIIISIFITRDLSKAFRIGFLEFFTKITLFYLHERIWQKIHWGKM